MLIAAPEGVAESLEFIGIASRPVEANIFATETFSEISSITVPILNAMCDGKLVKGIYHLIWSTKSIVSQFHKCNVYVQNFHVTFLILLLQT